MYLKNKKGISLITVVVAVVVVVVLTTVLITTSSTIPDEANFTKYMHEMKNVQLGIKDAKIRNSRKGSTEEKLNAGFEKIILEKAPTDFYSFGDIYEPTYGYLVSLETIGYEDAEYGRAYSKFKSGDTLTFGDKECDVFVYDQNWNVYYVKGLEYNGSMNYTID